MPLAGFGLGLMPGGQPEHEEPDAAMDLQRIRRKLVVPPAERVITETIASGGIHEIDTGQDRMNTMTVTVFSGTLYVFRGKCGNTLPQFPTYAFGALSPINPVEITLPYRVHEFTLYASGAQACFSMVLKAI